MRGLCGGQIKTSTSPPPGHLTIFCAREAGNLTGKDRVENFTFAWVGWGKLNNFEYKQP